MYSKEDLVSLINTFELKIKELMDAGRTKEDELNTMKAKLNKTELTLKHVQNEK